jgi:hypothetical protein
MLAISPTDKQLIRSLFGYQIYLTNQSKDSVEDVSLYLYAHALKKPTIILADKGKKLPFDLSSYRCSIGGKRMVEESLRKHLQAILDE